jgi:hypothetical protein
MKRAQGLALSSCLALDADAPRFPIVPHCGGRSHRLVGWSSVATQQVPPGRGANAPAPDRCTGWLASQTASTWLLEVASSRCAPSEPVWYQTVPHLSCFVNRQMAYFVTISLGEGTWLLLRQRISWRGLSPAMFTVEGIMARLQKGGSTAELAEHRDRRSLRCVFEDELFTL